jgi:hypothetical protein
MRNAPEVVREVGVHDVPMATKQQLLHPYGGLLGVAPGAHRPFRGLLGVHSRCGLHTRAVTKFVTAIRPKQKFKPRHYPPSGATPQLSNFGGRPVLKEGALDSG